MLLSVIDAVRARFASGCSHGVLNSLVPTDTSSLGSVGICCLARSAEWLREGTDSGNMSDQICICFLLMFRFAR
jgi:hypothetical protein